MEICVRDNVTTAAFASPSAAPGDVQTHEKESGYSTGAENNTESSGHGGSYYLRKNAATETRAGGGSPLSVSLSRTSNPSLADSHELPNVELAGLIVATAASTSSQVTNGNATPPPVVFASAKYSKQEVTPTVVATGMNMTPQEAKNLGTHNGTQSIWPEALKPSNRRLDHLIVVVHGIGDMLETKTLSGNLLALSSSLQQASKLANSPRRILVRAVEWHSRMQDKWRVILHKAVPGYPHAQPSVVRSTIQDYFGDIILFGSPRWKNMLIDDVADQIKSEFDQVRKAYPRFSGRCSLFCHSLGSVIGFELFRRRRLPDYIKVDQVFCLGSPVAAYMSLEENGLEEMKKMLVSSDSYPRFYNIFHPLDPTAFRWEPFLLLQEHQDNKLPRAVQVFVSKESHPFHLFLRWLWGETVKTLTGSPVEQVEYLSHLQIVDDMRQPPSSPKPQGGLLLVAGIVRLLDDAVVRRIQRFAHGGDMQNRPGVETKRYESVHGYATPTNPTSRLPSPSPSVSNAAQGSTPKTALPSSASRKDLVSTMTVAATLKTRNASNGTPLLVSAKKSSSSRRQYQVGEDAEKQIARLGSVLDVMNGRRFDFEMHVTTTRPFFERMVHWDTIGAHFSYWTSVDVAAFVLNRIEKHLDESSIFGKTKLVDPKDKLLY